MKKNMWSGWRPRAGNGQEVGTGELDVRVVLVVRFFFILTWGTKKKKDDFWRSVLCHSYLDTNVFGELQMRPVIWNFRVSLMGRITAIKYDESKRGLPRWHFWLVCPWSATRKPWMPCVHAHLLQTTPPRVIKARALEVLRHHSEIERRRRLHTKCLQITAYKNVVRRLYEVLWK